MGFSFPCMILIEQVKAILEYVFFLKHLNGKSDCQVFSLNQTTLHLVGRPTSGCSLSCVCPRLHLTASLGLKKRWKNKLPASPMGSWSLSTTSAPASFSTFPPGYGYFCMLRQLEVASVLFSLSFYFISTFQVLFFFWHIRQTAIPPLN